MNENRLTISADDFGIVQSVSDSILEVVDSGSINNVSIMPNGLAFEYALEELRKRKDTTSLSIHINLTEGQALTDVPLLTDKEGRFKYSVFMLGVAFFFSLRKEDFRNQLRSEIKAQIDLVLREARQKGITVISINGHQHVHVLPGISEILDEESNGLPIRAPREFFAVAHISDLFPLVARFLGWALVQLLQKQRQNPFSDAFIGLLYSGDMTFARVKASLQRIGESHLQTIELLFHPGSAALGELQSFCPRKKGELWHYSPNRLREKNVMVSTEFKKLIEAFLENQLPTNRFMEIFRFGIAGGISTFTNLALLFIFTDLFGFWYVGSAVVAYSIAIGVSFTLQKFWAFAHNDVTHVRTEVLWYLANNLLGIIFDAVGLYILVEYLGVWYLTSQFALLALIATWNFFVYRFFIFKIKK